MLEYLLFLRVLGVGEVGYGVSEEESYSAPYDELLQWQGDACYGFYTGGGYPVNLFAYVLIPSDSGVKHLVSFQVKGFASGVEVREREGTSALELGNKIIHRGFF